MDDPLRLLHGNNRWKLYQKLRQGYETVNNNALFEGPTFAINRPSGLNAPFL